MGKLIDWSLDQLGKLPPIPAPFLLGFLVVFLLVFPTIRKAWRAHVDEPPKVDPLPVVQLNAGGIYTVLTNIQLAVEQTRLEVQDLSAQVKIIDMMIRRRGRGKPQK